MKMIVGLGNIGEEYNNTRHNVGFMFIDFFIKDILGKGVEYKKRDNYLYFETRVNEEKMVYIKPTTYMNLSGEAILKAKKWYKIEDKDIIVIYDDIDIKLSKIRYRDTGSAGTHNGMRNVLSILKTENLKRIRIGISDRQNNSISLVDYVLGKFSKDELNILYEISFKDASEKLMEVLKENKN